MFVTIHAFDGVVLGRPAVAFSFRPVGSARHACLQFIDFSARQVAKHVPVGYSPALYSDHPVEIEFRQVSLRRGDALVLRDFDLSVVQGETVALVGRSGAGKSTVLKLINRLLVPDEGQVLVAGKPTTEWDPFELRRRLGYVLQEVGLFPHMSVAQNVSVVPRLLNWPDADVDRRARELLDLVGLSSATFGPRSPQQLSGGQRQRVGVARALAADPPVLLMDEPFGALDPVTRSELHHEFRRIQDHVRKTIVIVTHDMAEAFALASRIGVVAEGRLAAFDVPSAIARSEDDRVRPLLAPLLEAREAVRDAG